MSRRKKRTKRITRSELEKAIEQARVIIMHQDIALKKLEREIERGVLIDVVCMETGEIARIKVDKYTGED